MNVRELIARLAQYDPDALVTYDDGEFSCPRLVIDMEVEFVNPDTFCQMYTDYSSSASAGYVPSIRLIDVKIEEDEEPVPLETDDELRQRIMETPGIFPEVYGNLIKTAIGADLDEFALRVSLRRRGV